MTTEWATADFFEILNKSTQYRICYRRCYWLCFWEFIYREAWCLVDAKVTFSGKWLFFCNFGEKLAPSFARRSNLLITAFTRTKNHAPKITPVRGRNPSLWPITCYTSKFSKNWKLASQRLGNSLQIYIYIHVNM